MPDDLLTLPRHTLDEVMALQPCRDRVWVDIFALLGLDTIDARDVLLLVEDGQVTPVDCLWLVLRDEWLPARILRLFACDCADRALQSEREAGREPDKRSWAAVEVARRYANGEASDEELRDAWSAAASAALDAAYAAWAAADAASYSAKEDARSAAWAAAYSSADAARAAERAWQVAHLREMLEGEYDAR